MDVERLYDKALKTEEYGPHIEIREHNFLTNPAISKHLKNNKINIYSCDRQEM